MASDNQTADVVGIAEQIEYETEKIVAGISVQSRSTVSWTSHNSYNASLSMCKA